MSKISKCAICNIVRVLSYVATGIILRDVYGVELPGQILVVVLCAAWVISYIIEEE